MRALAMGDLQIGVGGPGRLQDQADVLGRIGDLAIEREAELILNAGDTLEGPTTTPEQLDVFAAFVARMREAGIPIVAAVGNGMHDQSMRGPTGMGIFSHIPGVDVHARPGVSVLGDVAVACLPWVHHGRLIATRNGGDRDVAHTDVAELLLRIAEGLREDCARLAPPLSVVLLAHWSVSGATLPTGLPVDLLREPIIPLTGLTELGFDAVVLGHIHRPQVLSEQPWIGYVGSPQPHNHGESGYEHGVVLLDVEPGRAVAEFVPLESRPFVTLTLDALEAEAIGDLDVDLGVWPDQVPAGAIVRVRYTATRERARRINNTVIRQTILDVGASEVKIEATIEREQTARVQGLDESLTELAALDLYLEHHPDIAPHAPAMRARAAKYLEVVA